MAVYHQSQLRMAVVRDLRDKLFQKAMKLPLSFYTNEKKGDIMSRMNSDANEIEVAVIAMLELIFREPISLITYLGVLIYWSPSLTLFSLILLPISALIIALIRKSLKRTAKNQQEQMGVLFSALLEKKDDETSDENLVWFVRKLHAEFDQIFSEEDDLRGEFQPKISLDVLCT